MKKRIISIAVASVLAASSTQLMAEQNDSDFKLSADNYTSMGIGAAAGALIAGPAGLVIGGIMGTMYNPQDIEPVSDFQESYSETNLAVEQSEQPLENRVEEVQQAESVNAESIEDDATEAVMVASANSSPSFNYSKQQEETNRIKEIITYDLSMDVYFKPGSVNFESFYARQLSSVLNLMKAMPELQLNLDGYSDRQGSEADNLQLSTERLDSVRDYFVSNGIDVNRINLQAHGEKNFVSTPGELESYIFDRRVVVSFEISPQQGSKSAVASLTEQSSM
ncbi:MAG: OmpA family protein [Gammaproteobacteria bacterium]|nr:OmpA family protein [Gammaproteobacteria bacterium]